jgi:cytochrome c
MSGLELNKVAAGVLVAGLIAMVAGKVADGLYHPVHEVEKRGYAVEVAEDTGTGGAAEAEKPENILPLLASADVAAGEALTKKCTSCHTFENGGANKVGPNLYGIVGSHVAHKSDYSYSDAVAGHGGTWDYNSLSHFIKKPKAHIPGTKMAFAGISKESDRANLIAYLRTLSATPVALPTEAEIAAATPDEPATENAGDAATEQKAEQKADQAIQKDAGEKEPEGKTPEAEQAKEMKKEVEAQDE